LTRQAAAVIIADHCDRKDVNNKLSSK